jgi:hypothetical protein
MSQPDDLDPQTLLDVRASILLAAAIGIMEHLTGFEPAKHTRRYRMLTKAAEAMSELFVMYPSAMEYDLVSLGLEFFDKEHDARLSQLMERGIQVLPPEAPGELKKLVFSERWKRGDVLYLNGTTIVIHSVHPGEYHYISGPALLYSSTNYPSNPFLHKWKRIAQLGEHCTDQDLRIYVHTQIR